MLFLIDFLCFGVALGLLGLGLLAVFRAPTLWMAFAAVGATELGHWFALAAVLLAALGPKHSVLGWTAAGAATLAAFLLFSPAVRASLVARRIRRQLETAFGPVDAPFRWRDLLRWPTRHRPGGEQLVMEGPGGPLKMDFYRARRAGAAPLIVIAHGGGWMAGNVHELAAWNRWFAELGYAVAIVDYRLVPTGAWPQQRDDVDAALDFLRARSGVLGIDPDRVVLMGRSAGGQIASVIAATDPAPWLRGCICLYAPFDMHFAYALSRDDDGLRSRWLLRCYLGGPPEAEPEHYHRASAYEMARPGAPPFLLLHGGRDELVWVAQSQRFSQRLDECGVPNVFIELPWAAHAFDYNLHGPGGQILRASLRAFLRRVTSQDA